MSEAPQQVDAMGDETAAARRPLLWRLARWVSIAVMAVLALLFALVAYLHTPPGRQFIVDQISSMAPASGLSVEVGSIDGSVLWSATLHDVRLRDADGVLFLEAPIIELNWRPLAFFWRGLDVRHLVLSDGQLHAAPRLIPGDPDAPILPDFDIRIDQFLIENLRVSEALLGEERVVDFRARADIRAGLVYLDAEGALGGEDRFDVLIHAEPDGDRFDLDLDYHAPAGGFLAALTGAEGEDLALRLDGRGSWTAWQGQFAAVQGEQDLADLAIYNSAGDYRIVGTVRPGGLLEGLPAKALGESVELNAMGTLADSVLEGSFTMRGAALAGDATGAIDLAQNAFRNLVLDLRLLDPALFGEGALLHDASLRARLDGSFAGLAIPHELRVGTLETGGMEAHGLLQRGTLTVDGARYSLPLDMQVERVVSGNAMADPRLVNGHIGGTLVYQGDRLMSDDLALRFQGAAGDLALRADLARGVAALTGPVSVEGLDFEGIGIVDGRARIRFGFGGAPWQLSADVNGRVREVTNNTIAAIAGAPISFTGALRMSQSAPILFENMTITSPLLQATFGGRVTGGATTLEGSGRHSQYGPFTIEAELGGEGPRAVLVLADPLPAAGIANMRLALAPIEDGFAIETNGDSALGPFDGFAQLVTSEAGDMRISITRLDVSQTRVTGDLALADGGVAGVLDLARGGVSGTVELSTRDGGQAFDAALRFADARFGGAVPIAVNAGSMDLSGFFGGGSSTIEGQARISGLGYGTLFLRRVAVQAEIINGSGRFDGAIAGQRGSRFELLVNGQVAPGRIAVALDGSLAGRAITMPRRAVLNRTDDGGWRLDKTQLGFGDGYTLLEGRFGGEAPMEASVSLARMPLSLLDIGTGELGLGGTASGRLRFGADGGGQPVGSAQLRVEGLTRSGLVLTSRPMNLALVADLSAAQFQARAVMEGRGGANGRLQARIRNMPAEGGLANRLFAGDLRAQFRYSGPASSLWRLAALDIMDVRGPLQVAADIRGTLSNPRIEGSLAGDELRVQSALTGSDISNASARGRFTGLRLALTRFTGTAPNGGSVLASGIVDLSDMAAGRGPRLDLRIAARRAEILDLPTMGATVTGPLRILSNGVGGTLAGRLAVDSARWRLGAAAETTELPNVDVEEINLPPDIRAADTIGSPWRYLIDARAGSGIQVDGMGLDSEWRGQIRLRGTTDDPRIGGEVEIVPRRGFYNFAGAQFDITRGRIQFDEASAPDPRVEIVAESEFDGTDIAVNVNGTASQPEISFTSVPALPEEELLARILFGGSLSDISAIDALQLGSALASLRGGSGLGPINELRSAIGLDRLRLVPADPALGRGTSVALGKNINRRFYAEIITDGADYNASELEFRVTGWLSLLGSISTIGRHSIAAEYSRDY